MEQQQTKIRFPLWAKFMLTVLTLLVVIISYLSFESVIQFHKDKKGYVYESQATQALLGGKEFISIVRSARDTLRVSLGTFDPRRSISMTEKATFENIFKNQNDLVGIAVFLGSQNREQSKILIKATSQEPETRFEIKESLWELMPEYLIRGWNPLAKDGVYTFSLAQQFKAPVIGVALADLSMKIGQNYPIAIGILPLEKLAKGLSQMQTSALTIADDQGNILYDSDPVQMIEQRSAKDDPIFQAAISAKTTQGSKEYIFEKIEYLGSYLNPEPGIVVVTRTKWADARRATDALIEQTVKLGLMVIFGSMLLIFFLTKSLTAPINQLVAATEQVAGGNFELDLKASSGDEIALLSSSFNVMSKKISDLIQESVEKTRLEGELAIAATVQATLFPAPEYQDERVHIRGFYQSASECGGDWWGFFVRNNKLAIFIADATGHGMPSALVTAAARSCFSVIEKLSEYDEGFMTSPAQMLSIANRAIHDSASGKINMTFFAAVVDFDSSELKYSSAGHNPPWLFQKGPNGYKLKSLTARGVRLGENLNIDDFEEKTIEVFPDDVLFLYTDGTVEGTNLEGKQYTKQRMKRTVEAALKTGGAEGLFNDLIADLKAHNEGKSLDDDITIAVAKLLERSRI